MVKVMAKYSDKLNVPKEGKKITLKFHGVLCVPGPVIPFIVR